MRKSKVVFYRIQMLLSNFELAAINGTVVDYILKREKSIKYTDQERQVRDLILRNLDDKNMSGKIYEDIKDYKIINDKTCWEFLYRIERELINSHRYSDAYTVRKLSEHCTLKIFEQGKFITNRVKLIWDLVNDNQTDEAVRLIRYIRDRSFFWLTKKKFSELEHMICGICKDISLPARFRLLLTGKETVLVGPLAKEIPDKVSGVTINYTGKKKHSYFASFYNGEISSKLPQTDIRALEEDIDLFCFHRIKYEYQKELFKKGKSRFIWGADYMIGLGQPNMMQSILYHLMSEGCKNIYITGFNLYSSINVYGDNWKTYALYENQDKSAASFRAKTASFSRHNIITQYMFTKTLYDRGMFKCDEMLKNIMEQGIEKYLEGLEKLAEKC